MNLISDLSNEMAMAILVKKEFSEKIKSTDAVNLIGKVQEILQPTSGKEKKKVSFLVSQESKLSAH